MPDAGGGLAAYAVSGRGGGADPLMAVRVTRHAPPRIRALQPLLSGFEGVLTPVAHGPGPSPDGEDAYYVVCQAPSGPPLSLNLRPWPEAALIEQVLRPAATVLEELRGRGLTHRAIRPDNVFLSAANKRVVLGAAWACPPAMHQPAVFEPCYVAICHPCGRGDGVIGDDVYALGVLLVTLALGRVPMQDLDDAAILRRKVELGDFTALTAGAPLPPMLADIVRGMVAEDPEHRPPPALLRDPAGVRGRRVAARPPAHAAKPLKLGTAIVRDNRALALAMAREPAAAAAAMRNGTMMYWLRRGLGDVGLAVKLEELVRSHAQDLTLEHETVPAALVMRAIAAADPLMPLCWRGVAFWPDGLGTLLAAAEATPFAFASHELLITEAIATWAGMREERTSSASARLEARQARATAQSRTPGGGMPRLLYALNPLLPCASSVLGGRWITQAREAPPALDAIVAASPDTDLMEPHLIAFLAARSERRLEQEIRTLVPDGAPDKRFLSMLRLLSASQSRFHPRPLRALAAWATGHADPVLDRWRNLARRAGMEERLSALAVEGFLPPILALLDNETAQAADAEGLQTALAELARVDAAMRAIADGGAARAVLSARLGQELAAAVGFAAAVTALLAAALG